jgi:hypothetical protein
VIVDTGSGTVGRATMGGQSGCGSGSMFRDCQPIVLPE